MYFVLTFHTLFLDISFSQYPSLLYRLLQYFSPAFPDLQRDSFLPLLWTFWISWTSLDLLWTYLDLLWIFLDLLLISITVDLGYLLEIRFDVAMEQPQLCLPNIPRTAWMTFSPFFLGLSGFSNISPLPGLILQTNKRPPLDG
jgi:hypothetical protein